MRIRPKIGDDCLSAAMKASGERLTKDEMDAAFQRILDHREKLKAAGDITDMGGKLAAFAKREAERTRIAAAMQRRHAGLNILVRDRLEKSVNSMMDSGMDPRKALLAILEGTPKGIEGGRSSVAALAQTYEARYLGSLFAEIQKNRPHLITALRDPAMDTDITIEMVELRKGGTPGITKNKDAQYVAKVLSTYAELARKDANRFGASIGKLDGWAGMQTHDDIKMIAAGKETWVRETIKKIDLARTFPDIESAKDLQDAMEGIYDTIITGFSNKATPRERGQRVNPANLAKSLGKSRVLHFNDAKAALAYRDQFGYGNTISGMIEHFRKMSRTVANMDALGPNPEVMLGSVAESMKRMIKESSKIPDAKKGTLIDQLGIDAGPLRHALDISTGLISRPVNVDGAQIAASIRTVQNMAKLGGAAISSIVDLATAGSSSHFRGDGFMRGFTAQLEGTLKGRPKGEQAEISFLMGEGFDGLIGHIVSPAAATDGPVGHFSKMQELFFRLNGLSWWTDVQRATIARVIAAEMGMRSNTAYANLPPKYRHVLNIHSIDAVKWDAIRKTAKREVNGNSYITPENIRNLDDAAIEPLVRERIASARKQLRVDEAKTPETKAKREAQFAERKASIIDDGKRELELSVVGFVADETSYGIVETDARSRRTMTLGQRPGTLTGEAMRFIAQFKGFPMAFAQRVGGRALFGHRAGAPRLEKMAHIGQLLATMTMAGYAAIVMKDTARGYWPPRPLFDEDSTVGINFETLGAAFTQGGAAGIYGDFLFSRVNRFGGGLSETTMGPGIGSIFTLGDMVLKAKNAGLSSEEEFKWGDLLYFAQNNTPFMNLFYTRPALDYLFLNSLKELSSPGYMRRQDTKRRNAYGQERMPFLGDGMLQQ